MGPHHTAQARKMMGVLPQRIQFVDSGANRWVFLVGRWAIKVPRMSSWRSLLFGLLNNSNEAVLASTSPDGACPVLWAAPGGWLIVMPRVRIMTDTEFGCFDCRAFCQEHGLVAEWKPDSFGFLGGRVVCVDYGWVT